MKIVQPLPINIRAATETDFVTLRQMCINLLESQDIGVPIDPVSLEENFRTLLNNPLFCFQIAEAEEKILGGIVGHLSKPLWNLHVNVAKILFWYIQPRFFSQLAPHLLTAFESWAIEQGAVSLMTTCLAKRSSQNMIDFFKAQEYESMEYLMVKKLQ